MNEEDAVYFLIEREDEILCETLSAWREAKGKRNKHQHWKLVPANLLLREWHNHATGREVDEDTILKIQEIMLDNCVRLYVNTVLFGHTAMRPFDFAEAWFPEDEDWTVSKFDKFLENIEDWACDEYGQWKISDYACEPLFDRAIKLIMTEDPGEKLFWIDQMLNVVHQRSDLARWFVEGGSKTVSQLFEGVKHVDHADNETSNKAESTKDEHLLVNALAR